MKTILVTGGAGFIGSNFVKRLFDKYVDYRILVLDALTYAGSTENLPANYEDSGRLEFWYGNVMNADIVDSLVARADIIYHFAAETHVTRSIYSNRLFFETDVIGTQVVANSILKHKDRIELFVHISTSEVYGSAVQPRIDEEHPLNPMSPYAAAKCGADRLVYSYWQTYQIPAVILRPFNNYGAYQHLEKAIPRFITSCLLDEPLMVHGTGDAARDWIHVDDHCDVLERLLRLPTKDIVGEVFNIGSGEHISVLEVAQHVAMYMGVKKDKIKRIVDRPGQVIRHTCDATKARKVLDWRPKIDFDEGIARTVSWYKENESWWRRQLSFRQIPIVAVDGKKARH